MTVADTPPTTTYSAFSNLLNTARLINHVYTEKRKSPDDGDISMSEPSPKRLKSVDPTTPETSINIEEGEEKPAKTIIQFKEKPAVIEERTGAIEFRVVANDNTRESMIILTGLKCIFQKQLPK